MAEKTDVQFLQELHDRNYKRMKEKGFAVPHYNEDNVKAFIKLWQYVEYLVDTVKEAFEGIDYCVIGAQNLEDLESKVKGYIFMGWRPMGGVSIDEVSGYIQAMLKDKDEA
jgi:hypothetical protein